MNQHLFVEFIDLVGTVFIAYAALRVHHRVLTDQKIDRYVFTEMRREQIIGMLGVGLVILAFLLKIAFFYFS